MKLRLLFLSAVVALVSAGCGQKDASSSAAPTTAAPAAGPRIIEITAGDNMKFSLATIEAKAGEEFKVVLVNIGTQPKEVMGHNLVVLKPGTDVAAYATAAAVAKATDYVPEALSAQVVAHTPLLGPRKSAEITLKLEAGDYPFVCSFPAHFQVGMKGVIVVK